MSSKDLRNLEDLSELIRGGAEEIRPSLKPQDDWQPMAFIVKEDHSFLVLPSLGWNSDEERDAFFNDLAAKIVLEKAVAVGVVATVWMITGSSDLTTRAALRREPRPRDHPLREEALLVYCFSHDRLLCAIATIERHPKTPPTMKEWHVSGDAEGGPMTAPIMTALRKVRNG